MTPQSARFGNRVAWISTWCTLLWSILNRRNCCYWWWLSFFLSSINRSPLNYSYETYHIYSCINWVDSLAIYEIAFLWIRCLRTESIFILKLNNWIITNFRLTSGKKNCNWICWCSRYRFFPIVSAFSAPRNERDGILKHSDETWVKST